RARREQHLFAVLERRSVDLEHAALRLHGHADERHRLQPGPLLAGWLVPDVLELRRRVAGREGVPARSGATALEDVVRQEADMRGEGLRADRLEPRLTSSLEVGRGGRQQQGEEEGHFASLGSRGVPSGSGSLLSRNYTPFFPRTSGAPL